MGQDAQPTAQPAKPRPNMGRRLRWWRYALAGVLLLWALFWGFLALAAPGMIKNAAASWARGIGRTLTIDQVVIRPWTMSLELDGVRMLDKDGNPLFSAARIQFDAWLRAALIGRWHAQLLALDQPRLYFTRAADGSWNWARLAHDAAGPRPARPTGTTTPAFWLDLLQIDNGQLHIQDHLGGPARLYDILQVNFNLRDLSTRQETGAYVLSAEMGAHTRLNWRGSLNIAPVASAGRVRLSDLALADIWPYVTPFVHLAPPQGSASLDLNYVFDLKGKDPRLTLNSVYTRFDGLRFASPDGQHQLALQTLALDDGMLDLQKHSVFFKRVRLNNGDLSAARGADGAVDWMAALPAPATAPKTTRPAEPGWKMQVNELRLENWKLALTDGSFQRPLQVNAGIPLLTLAVKQSPQQGLALDRLAVNVASLQVGETGKAPVLTVGRLLLNGASLAGHQIQLGVLTIKQPALMVERSARGELNLAAMRPRQLASGRAVSAWKFTLPQVNLTDGLLSWSDRMPGNRVAVRLDQLAGSLMPQAGGLFDARLSGNDAHGHFDLKASLDPDGGRMTGALSASALPLVPLAPYALAHTPLRLKSGSASARLGLKLSPSSWNVSGQASINGLAIMEPGASAPLLGWHGLTLAGLQASGSPVKVSVRNLILDRPVARLVLDKQRVSNIRQLFAGNPGTAAPTHAGKQPAPAFEVRVVHVKNGDLDFTDQGMTPAFASQISHLTGTITALSSNPGKRGTLALNGTVDPAGDVRVSGVLAPMDIVNSADITLAFRNIALTSLNPYSETIAGWKIDDGSLSVGLHYVLNQRKIQGDNSIEVDSIKLGPRVERPGLRSLPLSLAVMLLEDNDGRIILNLPVSGSLDDPKFNFSGLVWQAFVNVIEKVVTAPFRALGALFGGPGFDDVRFVAGEASVAPPEREKLGQLVQMLIKRPQLKIRLSGTYDADADRKELARARIDRAILAAAGITLDADEPLPALDMQDASIQSAVKTVYGQRIGRMKLLARMVSVKGGPSFYAGLRSEAIAAEPVDNAALQALADQRAKNAAQFLAQAHPELATRITLGSVQPAHANTNGVPLAIELVTN